jgi:YD repeat-containing protein
MYIPKKSKVARGIVYFVIPALATLLIYGDCSAINTEKYFPVKAGATWSYYTSTFDNTPNVEVPPPTTDASYLEAAAGNGSGRFKFSTTEEGVTPAFYQKDSFKGIILVDIGPDPTGACISRPVSDNLLLPLHMVLGQIYTSQIYTDCRDPQTGFEISGTAETTQKFVGTEFTSVPAGTFKTMVLEQTFYGYKGQKLYSKRVWLARGVGLVKEETRDALLNAGSYINVVTSILQSTNLTPEDGSDDDCDCTESADGTNINYATGAAALHETDISPTQYSPLSFHRIYKGNSGIDDGSLGAGWAHNYSRTASVYWDTTIGGSESIEFQRESGAVLVYSNKNGKWVSATDLKGQVSVTRNGARIDTVTYRTASNDVELYDAIGRLQSITHLGGMKTTLAYDTLGRLQSATDTFGRSLSFAYDPFGRITTVTSTNGNAVNFTFSPEGQLNEATLPEQKTRRYAYDVIREPNGFDAALRLKSIADQNGSEYLHLGYDEQGRLTSRTYGSGVGGLTIDYSDPASRVLSDSLSTARTVTFTKILGRNHRLSLTSECGECEDGGTAAKAYDTFGNVTERTNFNGITTRYGYDTDRSLEISRTEASGTPLARAISTAWHPQFRLPVSISEPLRRTTYEYDTNGNVLKKTVQATSDASGAQGFSAPLVGDAQVYSYTYGVGGRMLTAIGPRKDLLQKTEWTYGGMGDLVKIKDPIGMITQLSMHDADGRPRRIVAPTGTVFDFAFKSNGLPASVTTTADGHSETTTYEYDNAYKLKRISLPDQTTYFFTYDAAQRLTEVTDHIGNRVEFVLDSQGNRISEKIYGPNGVMAQQLARSFDTQGRLKQQIGGL